MASSSHDQEVPEFFSVFLHDRCTRQLHISSAFKTHIELSKVARRKATIRRPGTNQEWKVDLVEEDNEYYFTQGWEKFVEDNSLSDGEFMVFQYHGNSYFTVNIYGIHGCLKESVVEGQPITDVELLDVDDDDEEEEEDGDVAAEKRPGPGRPFAEDPFSEAVKGAKYYMKIHHDYPSFRIPIGGGYVKHHLLNIPLHFVDTYLKGKDKRTIKLQVMNKIWKVNMLVYRQPASPNCKLSKGVPAFIQDNNIQEGDVCVFELVKPDTFNISIFPC